MFCCQSSAAFSQFAASAASLFARAIWAASTRPAISAAIVEGE